MQQAIPPIHPKLLHGEKELLAAGGAASANSFMFAAGSVGSWLGLLAFRGSSLGLGFAGGLWAARRSK